MNEDASGLVLALRVSGSLCALPLGHVSETLRPRPVDALADVPHFVLGVALVRGQAMPVVDLGRLLGKASASATRWVVVGQVGRHLALAVDEVLGVRALTGDWREPLPPLLEGAAAGAVAALARLDDGLLLLLRASRLLPDAAWAAMQALDPEAAP